MTKHLEEDFLYINNNINYKMLFEKSFFITGSTGLIGGIIVKYLLWLNRKYNSNIKIYALVRNIDKANNLFNCKDIIYIKGDICNELESKNLHNRCDYIIHCAAVTNSKEMIEYPVDVAEGIVNGTQNILKFAKNINVKSMVYLSSMESYGNIMDEERRTSEEEQGYIDIFNKRSCYPMGKRMAEEFCFLYYKQYGLPVKIARLAQTFGAGVDFRENKVYVQFAKSVLNKENIVLYTDGSSNGNYVYTADAISGIFTLLLNGDNGEAYNIVNEENTMTIREMAELVSKKVANNSIKVECLNQDNKNFGYAAKTGLRLSAKKLEKKGWNAEITLEDMYKRMIGDFVETNEQNKSK